MPDQFTLTAERLQLAVPAAEAQLDGALIAISSLMTEVVTARRDIVGVPAKKGHATIHRLAQAQLALVGVSGDILRVHGELAEMGRERSGLDLHECPAIASDTAATLSLVA